MESATNMPDKKQVVSFLMIGLSCLGDLFCILALALNSWSAYDAFSSGLWKACFLETCVSMVVVNYLGAWLNAVRAFAFLGLFSMVGATVTAVLRTFIMKGNILILYLTTGLSSFSGLCMLIAFAVYTDNTPHGYGAAFALCIIAWLLGWAVAGLGGLLLLLNRATPSSYN